VLLAYAAFIVNTAVTCTLLPAKKAISQAAVSTVLTNEARVADDVGGYDSLRSQLKTGKAGIPCYDACHTQTVRRD